jgi:hypothetical protein
MKLNIETIKSILSIVEESKCYPNPISGKNIQLPGVAPVEVTYHLSLMIEAGLIRGEEIQHQLGQIVMIERLTWEGHEFLKNSQNVTFCQKLEKIGEAVGSFSIDVSKSTLAAIAQQAALGAIMTG